MPSRIDSNNRFQQAAVQVCASWLRLEAMIKEFEAAAMEDNETKADDLRQKLHSILDVHLDAKQATQVLVHESIRSGTFRG